MEPPVSAQSDVYNSDHIDEYPLEGISETDFAGLPDETHVGHRVDYANANRPLPVRHVPSHYSPLVRPHSQENSCEDVFNDDVDWDAAYTLTESSGTMKSSPSIKNGKGSSLPGDQLCQAMSPFVRPPFPTSASSKAEVPGISARTILRTCFRVGEMIQQTIKCHTQQQDVVFELFARILQSEREATPKRQHFLLTDLYKTRPPYPRATLHGWRTGSQLDQQSSYFLGIGAGSELCWCLCKPNKDPRSSIGWTYIFLSVRTVTWQQIQEAKLNLLGANDTFEGSDSSDERARS